MRYIITFLILLISAKYFSQEIPTINIFDAIEKGTINYRSTGKYDLNTKSEYVDADGQYYGKSMLITLHNKSKDTIYIYIPEGSMLLSEDSTVQDMLITKPLYAFLRPKQSKTYPVYAMCSEIHDAVPATIVGYKIAKNPDKALISIAQVIDRTYMQNVIGQGAVWAWTDNATRRDLKKYGATDETIKLTLGLLDQAGVKTNLAIGSHFVPERIKEANKDSIIQSLNKKLDYANTVLMYKNRDITLPAPLVYSGIGTIILLTATSGYFAFRKRKDKDGLA